VLRSTRNLVKQSALMLTVVTRQLRSRQLKRWSKRDGQRADSQLCHARALDRQAASKVKSTLVIACGAIAHELVAVLKANQWDHTEIKCLPAEWHNTPDKIVPAIREILSEKTDSFQRVFIAYGDCGTGGKLDTLIAEQHALGNKNIERLGGDHCYAFFAGLDNFASISNDDIGTFYLTDYLAANFDRLILEDLGIKAHPELLSMYFGNYNRLVYLSQQDKPELLETAKQAAKHIHTGLESFDTALSGIRVVAE